MAANKGWKSPDPAKKRRKAKAKAHKAPKVKKLDRTGLQAQLKSASKTASLVAQGQAEIVYRPTAFAPAPMPGVCLTGTRSEGRTTFESKDAKLYGERTDRKTTAKKYALSKRRNSLRYKAKRKADRAAGKYDPSSVGKPGAFKRPSLDTSTDVRSMEGTEQVFISRKDNVIVIPPKSDRTSIFDQAVTPKLHAPADQHNVDKSLRLAVAFTKSHAHEEYHEPTGKYTGQYICKKELQIVGHKKILVEEIWKVINGKNRLVGKVYEKGAPIKKMVVVEERVENFRPKTQRQVRIVRTEATSYSQTTAVVIARVNPDRLEKRAAAKMDRKLERLNAAERHRMVIDARRPARKARRARRLERKNAATAGMKAAA
jgi:hypothetical protein